MNQMKLFTGSRSACAGVILACGVAPAVVSGQTACGGPHDYELIHTMDVQPVLGGTTSWFGLHKGQATAHGRYMHILPLVCYLFDLELKPLWFPIIGTGTVQLQADIAFPAPLATRACGETTVVVQSAGSSFRAEHVIRGSAHAERGKCRSFSLFRRSAWARSSAGGSFVGRSATGGPIAKGGFGFKGEFANSHFWPFKVRAKIIIDPVYAEVLDASETVIDRYPVIDIRSVVYGTGTTTLGNDGGFQRLINAAPDMDFSYVIDPAILDDPTKAGELRLSVRNGNWTRQFQTGVFSDINLSAVDPGNFDLSLGVITEGLNYTIPLPPGAAFLQFASTAGAHSDATEGEVGDGCSLITGPGEGFEFASISAIADGNSLYGVPATADEHAMDFFTPATDMDLEEVMVPFFQESASATGVGLVAAYVQVWDGDPRAGGTVLWGDLTNNRLIGVEGDELLYRVGSDPFDKLNTDRAIKFASIDLNGAFVFGGRDVGIEVVLVGDPAYSEPTIPVSPHFNAIADRALAYDDATGQWSAIRDPASNQGVCLGMRVFSAEPDSCRADMDGDGVLDIFDFLMFFNFFTVGDLIADFDADGELTIFDFLTFQSEFDAGCP